MAVSYEQWTVPPTSEPTPSYYNRHLDPSYPTPFNLLMNPEYNTQQDVTGLRDTVPQTYVKNIIIITDFQLIWWVYLQVHNYNLMLLA